MSESTHITTLLTRLAEAWNAGDATAYAALFTEDADYISFDGTLTRGRAAIESTHRWLFEGPLKGSTMATGGGAPTMATGGGAPIVKPLADGAVLVISEGGTALPGGPRRASIVTFTAVRASGEWLFASFQNTRAAA
ncbi:SgcJ/EcaC family oxidoreductase [Nonomuraea sp. NN258]|uniref:SgcJ/EcaC family oxidoreductase n=1 Tax=Nonomuraea antri TaxID=2730852 RepID=UPI00156A6C9F|nr:SgcJ/EcaC family oxidoreductase [Nonomuraea antri]NRQ40551.1 SgcJ/EcaC family oxidoreductase [Nonomuraea antri]